MVAIEVSNITKRFDDKLVLDNISFEVEKGDIFGLIGPNGAGKSTLINIITGLVNEDAGNISVFGDNFKQNDLKIKSKLGLVPQNLALIKEMTAQDNLEYFAAFYGLSGKVLKERVKEALEIIGLTDRKKDKAKTFSGGMLRRLNLGIAIMHHPEILILDEPTVGVDPQSRNYIFEYLKNINKELGTTIIYTSHYMEEIESLCNKIFIIDLGREIAYGTRKEILALNNQNEIVELNIDGEVKGLDDLKNVLDVDAIELIDGVYKFNNVNKLEIDEIIEKIHSKGYKIKGINISEPKLEEVFLSLTGKSLRD